MAAVPNSGPQWPILPDGTLDVGALPAYIAALAGAIIDAEICGATHEVSKCRSSLWLAKCILADGIVPTGIRPPKE